VALHDVSGPADLTTWVTTFGATHPVLDDSAETVYNQYRGGAGRPWYVVFDRDMTIVFKGVGTLAHEEATETVLDLLDTR